MLGTIISAIKAKMLPIGLAATVAAIYAARNTEICINLATTMAATAIPIGIGYLLIVIIKTKNLTK